MKPTDCILERRECRTMTGDIPAAAPPESDSCTASLKMNCPKCKSTTLEPVRVRGIEVDRCNRCGGVWFDDKELEGLLELKSSDLRPLRGGKTDESLNRRKGRCPRDTSELLRVCSPRDATLILDVCPDCHGVWLDGGEFSRLA